ncbi:GntR family transcriptional regulator [Thioclava sp. SK-1]|uniref:GntR family transcriptional regulator n=1 Tax=Thioclava sp. SK-1 TaxID=1889770 RepID=UPI000826C2D8|nr:GntR family transcriptional regulator [Thioclava sp. SK-1]OCX66252.1 GntR family transcriptional regulator [Thioclava sp. SK-1]
MKTLAREAHSAIIQMIFDGRLKSGDTLGEASLGKVLGMSRTPVREALKRIESEGLAALEGRFLRVRQLQLPEFEEIFFLRLELEPAGAAAAVGTPDTVLDALEADIQVLMARSPVDESQQWQVDTKFHDLMAQAGGNSTIAAVISDLRQRTCIFDHSQVPDRFLAGCDEHLQILAAIRRGDGEGAKALMTQHLCNARDAVLDCVGDLLTKGNIR